MQNIKEEKSIEHFTDELLGFIFNLTSILLFLILPIISISIIIGIKYGFLIGVKSYFFISFTITLIIALFLVVTKNIPKV
jgi:hypothetical protein